MKSKIFKTAAIILGVALIGASCNKDLNVKPIIGTTPSTVYDNVTSIADVVAKVYGGFTLSGKSAGDCDLGNYDAGTSVLYRSWWTGEELTADQVKNGLE